MKVSKNFFLLAITEFGTQSNAEPVVMATMAVREQKCRAGHNNGPRDHEPNCSVIDRACTAKACYPATAEKESDRQRKIKKERFIREEITIEIG